MDEAVKHLPPEARRLLTRAAVELKKWDERSVEGVWDSNKLMKDIRIYLRRTKQRPHGTEPKT